MKQKKEKSRYSENVYSFLIHNPDLFPMLADERILLMEELDGRLSIALRITPELTQEKITRQLWDLIKLWRERLIAWQGYDHDNRYLMLEELKIQRDKGQSYPKIAQALNEKLSGALMDYCDFFDPKEDLRERHQSASEYSWWLITNRLFEVDDSDGIEVASKLGIHMMMYHFVISDDENFNTVLTSAYNNIMLKGFPFPEQAPYTPKLVQNAVERFEYAIGSNRSKTNSENPLLKSSIQNRDFIDTFPFYMIYKRQ